MKRRKSKREQRREISIGMYLRLIACALIICSAVIIKHINPPIVEKVTEAVSKKLGVDEAVEAISGVAREDSGTMEASSEERDWESEAAFNDEFYIDKEKENEREKEIEENRKKAEEEAKQLSVETLSFQMGEEELHDDTKAEVFRIPPPSYCSYDKVKISFKFRSPLYGIITSRYGYRDHPIINDASFHTGLDIAAKSGSTIAAFADGKVIEAGRNSTYGNYLLIEHKDGIKSFYGHNSKLSVKKGQSVKLGQKVAEVGSTGMSTGPHLHFEVRKNNIRLDPALYISPETI